METCGDRQEQLCLDCKEIGILFWGFCNLHQSQCRPQNQEMPDTDEPEEITAEITGKSNFEM